MLLALCFSAALATPPPASLVGVWTLDVAASSDPAPVLAKLGVPSFLASASGSSTQTLSIVGDDLVVTVDGAFGERTETVDFDQKKAYTGSMFGYDYRVFPKLDGEAVVSAGTIRIGGKDQFFQTRRTAAGAVMTIETTIGTGAEAVTLRRVFRKS